MFILVLATDGSWWARYTPYLYLIPIFNLIYMISRKNKLNLVFSIIFSILLLTNISLIIYANCDAHLNKYTGIGGALQEFESYANTHDEVTVKLKTTGFEGIKYNIADLEIDLNKVKYVEEIENPKKNVYFFSYHKE